MAESTEISWADGTFNPWIGCTKVSPACDFCYAARDNERRKWVPGWGTGVPRRRTKTWGDPIKWNKQAAITGYRPRIFCASLADVFDNEVEQAWRNDLWVLLRATPNLRWMLLTKRIGNAPKMLPADWPYPHVGLMSTLENQEVWDRDYHKLARVPAAWHGVSAEPLLGPINIGDARPDWIITGGESGAHHRHTDPDWVRSLRDQCAANGIAFHHKQWGGVRPKANGCELDGREHKDFPVALENGVRMAVDALKGIDDEDRVVAAIRNAMRFAHEVSDRMDAEYGPQRFTYLDRKREPEPPPSRLAQWFDKWMCP